MSFSLPGLSPLGGGSPSAQSPALPGLSPLTAAPSTQVAAPKPPAGPAAPVNPTNTTPGTNGYGMNNAEYLQGIQQEYGAGLQGAQNQINAWNAYLPTAQNDLGNVAQTQIGTTNAQAEGVQGSLNTQAANTRSQQQLSLAQLADQIHGQNQGLLNQLGAVGAGFSSASQTGQQALAHAQNTQAANIDSQAGQNIALVNQEKDSTEKNRLAALDSINAWKSQQINSLLNTYNQTMSSLQQALGTAQGEEKARLALYGQSITDAAGQHLNELQNATQGAINSYTGTVAANRNAAAPSAQFQNYQEPAALQTRAVSPFQATTSPGNATGGAMDYTGGGLAALGGDVRNQNQTALA